MSNLMIIAMIVSAIVSCVEAYFDSKKKNPEHKFSAAIRLIGSYLVSFLLIEQVFYQIVFTAILLNIYWIVFDPMYNVFKGYNWQYIGSTAKLDKLAKKWFKNGSSYLYMKIWLLFGFVVLLLI